jgi:hypothetical protein
MSEPINISIKGKIKSVPTLNFDGVSIIVGGKIVKTAEIFDEYWLEGEKLPNPESVIEVLKKRKDMADLFTFTQKIPNVEAKYRYPLEWDNVAVMPVSTYEHWFQKQISSSTKRNIKASEKRGVSVKVAEYNEEYIKGIMSIYNESPIRHGKKYWHFGKNFTAVEKENGTYAGRSSFLAAYHQDQMIGYLKIVWDKNMGAIMQILSRMEFFNSRPNNALLSEAVKLCEHRGANYLLYEKFDYGKKTGDSLTKFKENNGFIRMDVPRYFIPLTRKGSIALRLGLHKDLKERLPERIMAHLRVMRSKYYNRIKHN